MCATEQLYRRRELNPLNDVLFQDPIAMQIAERYVTGEICTLLECLFQIAKHCSKHGRDCAADEVELLIKTGFPFHPVSKNPCSSSPIRG